MEPFERLVLIRKKLKLTPQEMADKLGYQVRSYKNLEKGRDPLNEKFTDKLQKTAPVNLEYLYSGIGEMFMPEEQEANEPEVIYKSGTSFFIDGVEYKHLSNHERVDVLLAQNSRLMSMLETQIASVNILSKNLDVTVVSKNVSGAVG